jgi:hypothetical protein
MRNIGEVVVIVLLAPFFIGGVMLIGQSLWWLFKILQRRPFLLHTDGWIEKIGSGEAITYTSTSGKMRLYGKFHTVIFFWHQNGTVISFKAVHDDDKSAYSIGQSLPVIYDPANALPPMIDRGVSIWLLPLNRLFGGALSVGLALLLFKILGG